MDGFASSALFIKFMQYINCPIDILIDEGKTHGLTDSLMKQIIGNYSLVIVPDAGSNDIEQHKILHDNNIDLIVLDHHEILSQNVEKLNQYDNSIIINNQLLGLNKNHTGVGMVYTFLKHVNYYENLNFDIDKHLDLVALGQIGDVSNVADKEIRYYVTKGLNNITNPFIKSVMKRKGYNKMTGRDASFSIISMINAVTRVGTIEEKRDLIDALTSDSAKTTTVEVRKKNKKTGKFDKIPTEMTYQEIVAKQCEGIKTKQDKIVKDTIKNIEFLYNGKIIVAVSDDNSPSSINGLIGMKLCDKYKKPVMVGKFTDDCFSGSIRAQNVDFKFILTESRLFNFVSGHSQAAGFSIPVGNLDTLYNYIEDCQFETSNVHEVDVITNKPNENDIIQVELNKDVLGGKVEFPLFAYEEIEFNKRCINKRGSVLSFFDDNVTFVLFNAPDGIKEEIDSHIVNNKITMNIVGEPRISKFGNKEQPQIVIKDYEILEVEEDDELGMWGIDF